MNTGGSGSMSAICKSMEGTTGGNGPASNAGGSFCGGGSSSGGSSTLSAADFYKDLIANYHMYQNSVSNQFGITVSWTDYLKHLEQEYEHYTPSTSSLSSNSLGPSGGNSEQPAQPSNCPPMAGFTPGSTAQRNSKGCITGWVAPSLIILL